MEFLLVALSIGSFLTSAADVDVVIVGAGYGGLSAARALKKAGKTVKILEAYGRPGGRVLNHYFTSGHAVELGAEWIGDMQCQPHAYNLFVRELGIPTFVGGYPDGKGIYYSTNGPTFFYNTSLSIYEIPALLEPGPAKELTDLIAQLDKMAKEVKDEPWHAARAKEWDEMTFQSWIDQSATFAETRQVLRNLCTMQIAQEPKLTSLLHLLFYISMSGGISGIWDDNQEYRVHGGSQAPAILMASELDVVYNTTVHTITQSDTGVVVSGRRDDKAITVQAKYAIVTGPPQITAQIEMDPPMPFLKAQLFQRMPMGNSVKLLAVYDTPFWRNDGLNGKLYSTNEQALVRDCMDDTPEEGTPGILLCFAEGRDSIDLMSLTAEERKHEVTDFLAGWFGEKARQPVEFIDWNWAEQPYTRGAYAAFMTTGSWTQLGEHLRTPFGRIHWAGTEYAKRGFGFMDGAIASGHQTAALLVEALEEE